MKVQIRQGVFETNSSSVHTLTYVPNDKLDELINLPYFVDDEDNSIPITFGRFGWEHRTYYDWYGKLKYLLTMAYHLQTKGETYGKLTNEIFVNSEEFKKIDKAVEDYTNLHIRLDSIIKICSYEHKGEKYTYNDIDGYIDHQSWEDYDNFDQFLQENDITDLTNFIFGENNCVETWNDNDCDYYDSFRFNED